MTHRTNRALLDFFRKNRLLSYLGTSKFDYFIRAVDLANLITFFAVTLSSFALSFPGSLDTLFLMLSCWIPLLFTVVPSINLSFKVPGKMPMMYLLSFISQGLFALFIPVSFILTPLVFMNLTIFIFKLKNIRKYWRHNLVSSSALLAISSVFILQVIAVVPSCNTGVHSFTLPANHSNDDIHISFFVEWYYTDDDITYMFSDQALELLRDYNSTIYLLIPESNLTAGSYAENVTALLNSWNVSVWAWLATSDEHGYYYTDETAFYFQDLINAVHSWSLSRNLTFEGMMLDIEPNRFHSKAQQESFENHDYLGALMDFRSQFNDAAYESSSEITPTLVNLIKDLGYKVAYCGPDLYLQDSRDNDDDLLKIFGLPHPIDGFDRYIMMIYRTLYPWAEKHECNGYIYHMGKNYLERFGDRASIALATIGRGPYGSREYNSVPGRDGIALLQADIMLLRNLGIKEVPLWCLEWLLWFDWDSYLQDLETILSTAIVDPVDTPITIDPTDPMFQSILITADVLMSTRVHGL
ncbi:MAG: hypothetical protein ACTSRA_02005 [Promethearchaeota archaeon]